MAHKKAPTDEELSAMFEGIGDDANTNAPAQAPKSSISRQPKPGQQGAEADDDPLAELSALASARPTSRPNTPRVPTSVSGRNRSPKRSDAVATPSTGSARTSEDRAPASNAARRSGESNSSVHRTFTPTSSAQRSESPSDNKEKISPQEQPQKQAGGGWWGGLFATASAAVKQAEAAVKEIQNNEEAQRWAEQVRGNVGALRGIGSDLRSRALPTFTNILHTLAPPISQHERLAIHATHDLLNYPSLDPLIYNTFSRVMSQVEGGSLLVIQRGSQSKQGGGFSGGGGGGWSDGPWWRESGRRRDIGLVKGLVEGTKLARVSAESFANEFFGSHGGVEEAAKQATEVLSESNPTRSSDIFLAIQAINHTAQEDLFSSSAADEQTQGDVEDQKEPDDLICFAVYLLDPIHSISFPALSQSFPAKWIRWLDAASASQEQGEQELPDEIREIIDSGGLDPREWVSEWVEDCLGLTIGIVAQRYVSRRMGVGEGGLGRGKMREEVMESGGGEAARAI